MTAPSLDPQGAEGATDGQHRHNSLIRMAYECPRCLHLIPNDDEPGLYPGALSRANNETEVCSICGTDEAMGNGPIPSTEWPVRIPQSVYDGAALQRKQVRDLYPGV
jgi:hypothetical protein